MPSHHSPGQCHTCDVTLSTSETLCLIMVRDCSTIAQMTKLTSVSLTVSAGDLTNQPGHCFFLAGKQQSGTCHLHVDKCDGPCNISLSHHVTWLYHLDEDLVYCSSGPLSCCGKRICVGDLLLNWGDCIHRSWLSREQ